MTEDERKVRDAKRERMLCYIRDVLIERAHSMRSAFESNSFQYCLGEEGRGHLKQVIAVEAAADVFTHLVGQWQAEPKHPEWLKEIVGQGMATFIEAFQRS